MGIPGLTTFIASYESKHHEVIYIRGCPVVIDGYNLMFTLHYARKNRPYSNLMGGDYIGFAKKVRDYFQSLKDCLISPVVIMDGAIEEEKRQTIQKRFQQNISEVVHEKIPGKSLAPIGLYNIFIEILVEQKIAVFQTKLEADDTIAFVAIKLNCPILSSDSDFHIYPNLTAIPLNAVQFRRTVLKTGVKGWTLTAKITPLRKLCQKEFSFHDMKLLPLAALVLGNDRIPPTVFQNFLNFKPDKYNRIEYIFKWFSKQQNYERALRTMMESVKEVDREETQALIVSIVSNYMGESGETEIWGLVEKLGLQGSHKLKVETKSSGKRPTFKFSLVLEQTGLQVVQHEDNKPDKATEGLSQSSSAVLSENITKVEIDDLKSESGIYLPDWFLQDHYMCKFSDELIRMIINRIVLLNPQVEPPSFSSAQDLALPIIQITAGILGIRNTEEIEFFSRVGKQVWKRALTPLTNLPKLGAVPTIQDPSFSFYSRENIVLETFELTIAEKDLLLEYPASCKLVIITTFYFIKKLARNEGPAIVIGVVLSFLKNIFMSNGNTGIFNEKDKGITENSISTLIKIQGMTTKLASVYRKFESTSISIAEDYKIERVYHYSQYQCILKHGITLNQLLGNPFKSPKFQVLDSYLIYNIMESVLNEFQGDAMGFLHKYFQNTIISPIFEKLFEVSGFKFIFSKKVNSKKTPPSDKQKEREIHELNRFSSLSID